MTDDTNIDLGNENLDANIDTGVDASSNESSGGFIDTIPEEFRDKNYMKGVDSIEQLMHRLDFSQSQLGKKGLPTGDSPEEFKAFFDQFADNEQLKGMFAQTAPESYDFGESLEGIKEEHVSKFSEIAKELNLSNDSAKDLLDKWVSYESEVAAAQDAKWVADFESAAQDKFGEKWAESLAEASTFIQKHVDQDIREALANVADSKQLLPLVMATHQILQNAPKSDAMPSNQANVGMSITEMKAKMNAAREKAMNNPMDSEARAQFHKFEDMFVEATLKQNK